MSRAFRNSFLGDDALRRAVRDRHRHAIEQASRRWRGGGRDDAARTRREILISTQVTVEEFASFMRRMEANKIDHVILETVDKQLVEGRSTQPAPSPTKSVAGGASVPALKSNVAAHLRPLLNHDLHAIDAILPRRRGGAILDARLGQHGRVVAEK